MDKLLQAQLLRVEADRLEQEHFNERSLPPKWKVGMRVRFITDSEWGWAKGEEATIRQLRGECHTRQANEYQVFWTEPDKGGARWWTTPADVEWIKP